MTNVEVAEMPEMIVSQGLSQGVQALTTTRHGGVSVFPYDSLNLGGHVGDAPEAVQENRRRLRRVVPQAPCWLNQVHGTHVFDADTHSEDEVPTADAAITTRPGRVLAILTADCLPVVVSADDRSVLGVAHAGWRGLADGVLLETLAAMRRKVAKPLPLRAWIGPSIGPMAFQVGDEVRVRFMSIDPSLQAFFQQDTTPGKWRADLPGIAAWQLKQQGVLHVERSDLCTMTDPMERFFSYRRDGQTGRIATLAWIVPTPLLA